MCVCVYLEKNSSDKKTSRESIKITKKPRKRKLHENLFGNPWRMSKVLL